MTTNHKSHWPQWLLIALVAMTLSPIGTIIISLTFRLDGEGTVKLIAAQCIGFVIVWGLSNGGDGWGDEQNHTL